MKRVRFVLILAYSIVFLIAVGVATMLIVTEWQDTPTPVAEVTEAPTAAPTEPRATLTPGVTPVTPQPTRTPRPTTTPAPTTVALAADDAITAANAAGLVLRGTIALDGAPDAQNTIRSFAWSPDGASLAVPEPANNRVALYDAETEELITTLAEQNEPVRSVAFSPDGALLAMCLYNDSDEFSVRVYDIYNEVYIAAYIPGGPVMECGLTPQSFSEDGSQVAVGIFNHYPGDGDPRPQWELVVMQMHTSAILHRIDSSSPAITALGADVVGLQERQIVRVFAVPEPVGAAATVLVYVPKARFAGALPEQVAALVGEAYGSDVRDIESWVGSSNLARITLTITDAGSDVDLDDLADVIDAATTAWLDQIAVAVRSRNGSLKRSDLVLALAEAAPPAFRPRSAAPRPALPDRRASPRRRTMRSGVRRPADHEVRTREDLP